MKFLLSSLHGLSLYRSQPRTARSVVTWLGAGSLLGGLLSGSCSVAVEDAGYGIDSESVAANCRLNSKQLTGEQVLCLVEAASGERRISDKDKQWLVCIAFMESGFNSAAINNQNGNGTIDVGLFQDNSIHFHETCPYGKDELLNDPVKNTDCALRIYSAAPGRLTAWASYNDFEAKKKVYNGNSTFNDVCLKQTTAANNLAAMQITWDCKKSGAVSGTTSMTADNDNTECRFSSLPTTEETKSKITYVRYFIDGKVVGWDSKNKQFLFLDSDYGTNKSKASEHPTTNEISVRSDGRWEGQSGNNVTEKVIDSKLDEISRTNYSIQKIIIPSGYRKHVEVRGYDGSGVQLASGSGLFDIPTATATDQLGVYIKQVNKGQYEIGIQNPKAEKFGCIDVGLNGESKVFTTCAGSPSNNLSSHSDPTENSLGLKFQVSNSGSEVFTVTVYEGKDRTGKVRTFENRTFDVTK